MEPLTTWRIDVTAVAPAGVSEVVVDVFEPRDGPACAVAFCFAGGGGTRHYFDLDVAGADGGYSMARHLASNGMLVFTVDHAGAGDSDAPEDVYELTPECLAWVNATVTAECLVRAGVDEVPVLGVGHSMGGLIVTYQQAAHASFHGLVLLGFGGAGLVSQLDDHERSFANRRDEFRAARVDLVARRFGTARQVPTPAATPRSGSSRPSSGRVGTSTYLTGVPVSDAVLEALGAASGPMLALSGFTAMMPGASDDEMAAVEVPLFVGVGDNDITGPAEAVGGYFTGLTDFTPYTLRDAGHMHNAADGRVELWDAVVDWITERSNPWSM